MKANRYSQPFEWEICNSGPDLPPEIALRGVLDESANLDDLADHIAGPVCFVAEGISRVNSMGAGKLFRLMQRIASKGPHRVVRGSPSFVRAVNMLPVLARFCQVDSVMAGFICVQCDNEHCIEVVSRTVRIELPEPACSRCGTVMKLDENMETYFRFMRLRR